MSYQLYVHEKLSTIDNRINEKKKYFIAASTIQTLYAETDKKIFNEETKRKRKLDFVVLADFRYYPDLRF